MPNAREGADMNWTETIVSAVTFLIAGLVMAGELAQETAPAIAGLISVGGVSLTARDLTITLFLTAAASFGAAAFRYRNVKAAAINWGLGFAGGFILAQLTVVVVGLPHAAMFGLAPCWALIAAKVARTIIHSDQVVDAAAGAIARLLGRIGGGK